MWETSAGGALERGHTPKNGSASSNGGGHSLVAPLLWVPGVLRSQGAWAHAMKETVHGPAMAITPGVDLIDSVLVSDVVSAQSSFEEQLNAKDQVILRFFVAKEHTVLHLLPRPRRCAMCNVL